MKKKVLFVATVDSHIELFHLPYLKMFKDKGFEVHVATNTNKPIKYCDKKIKLPIKRSPFRFSNLRAIRELRKNVNAEQYEIIHCHTPMGGVVARLSAKKARKNGTRVIYTAHGFHFYKGAPIKNWLMFYPIEKWLAKYTDTLITINKEDFDRAKRKFVARCLDIQYVPGVGVDEKKFAKKLTTKQKNVLRKSLGLKDNDKVFIFPAELSKRKNQMWLIKMLEPIFKKDRRCHLLLPGRDNLGGRCQKIAKKLNLDRQIHFLGFRDDILELLQISDVAISSAKQEGLPVNLIEAAMVGLPIVALDCRGNRDVCNEYKNGLVVCSDDEFREKIKTIKTQNENQILEMFLLKNIKVKMSDIYESGKIGKKYPIDFVVLWVDGSDQEWLKKKQKYDEDINNSNAAARYRDWEIFKYWFRGVEKYAPWVNHIYLVTDSQRPEWLNNDHPKLTIVDHKEIIDKKNLPTFNSQAIEINLHKIPGLSEHFVYFNDDMFLTNAVRPTDFFKNGKPVALANINAATGMEGDQLYAQTMFNNILLVNRHFKKKEVVCGHIMKWINPRYGSFNLRTLSQMPYPFFTGYKPHHVPAPLLKSTFVELWREEADLLEETSSHKFRHPHDVNQDIFTMWQLCKNEFVVGSKSRGKHLQLRKVQDADLVFKTLKHRRPKMLCINDSLPDFMDEREIDEVRNMLQASFDLILPNASDYEMTANINERIIDDCLVSVIVPIYNVKKYLNRCVDSILNQTYKDTEIILVDDGSTDGSGRIADEYGRKYQNVKVIHKQNGGLSSARNIGIKEAKGDWLAFIDSDDYVRKDYLSNMLRIASKKNVDIVTCSFEAFTDDYSKLKKAPNWPSEVLTNVEAIEDILHNRRPTYMCLSIFRTELFVNNNISFPEGREFEDMIVRFKVLNYARKIAFTNERLYYYLIRKNSITGTSISERRIGDYLKSLEEIRVLVVSLNRKGMVKFLNCFEFYSLITLLNYLIRKDDDTSDVDVHWHIIHDRLRELYFKAGFLNIRNRFFAGLLLILSANEKAYLNVYRKIKNEG